MRLKADIRISIKNNVTLKSHEKNELLTFFQSEDYEVLHTECGVFHQAFFQILASGTRPMILKSNFFIKNGTTINDNNLLNALEFKLDELIDIDTRDQFSLNIDSDSPIYIKDAAYNTISTNCLMEVRVYLYRESESVPFDSMNTFFKFLIENDSNVPFGDYNLVSRIKIHNIHIDNQSKKAKYLKLSPSRIIISTMPIEKNIIIYK